ncbi:MAG: hypothetical protein WBD63_00305 [Phycisphaerae bacterium]|nr:hypothetical protein [Phycisphaerae bacterium]
MRKLHHAWIGGFLAVLVLPWSAALAAEEMEDESPLSPEEVAAHHARSEIRYGDAWVAVTELFQQYVATQAETQQALDQDREVRIELDDINRQVYALSSEAQNKERPIRAEMAKAVADRRKAEAALRTRSPSEPQYESLPPQPTRNQYSSDSYDAAMDRWRREIRRIRDQNRELKREYDKRLAEYQKAKADTEAVIQEAQTKVAECQQQLDTLANELETAQAPLLEKRQAVSDRMLALSRQAEALATRSDAMVEAFQAVPQELLWRKGIAEWDGRFHLLTDLRTLHTELQAEIERMRVELQEAARLAGRNFPADWRHPQQDKVDALKALLERAAQATAP